MVEKLLENAKPFNLSAFSIVTSLRMRPLSPRSSQPMRIPVHSIAVSNKISMMERYLREFRLKLHSLARLIYKSVNLFKLSNYEQISLGLKLSKV